jgi:hypothetical protein
VSDISRLDMANKLRTLRQISSPQWAALGFTTERPDPAFAPRDGIGLLVDACSARFRNASVKPLVDAR